MNPTTTRLAPVDPRSLPAYAPTTYVDFSQPEHRAAFEAALAKVRGELGREYPNVIGGERVKGDGTFDSINPSRPGELLGRFVDANGNVDYSAWKHSPDDLRQFFYTD